MQELDPSSIGSIKPDIIIDARSPREFAYSHIPNAQNFYALNDKEHEEIGTIYKNQSKHHAKVLGASYVCKNASKHLLNLEKSINNGAKIAIYCARGGLRSKSLGTILEQIGYRVWRVENGYKGYRNHVLNHLAKEPKVNFITLFGNTGCGKTRLIKRLSPHIDLEGLANHQGSTFGLIHGTQPTTKTFENNLSSILEKLDNESFCFIEGESRKIGNLTLPKPLYEKMHKGINVQIISSMEHRVKRIVSEYSDISDDFFFTCIKKIKPYIQKSAKEEIIKNYNQNNIDEVAHLLLENYYDKVYKQPKRIDYTIRFDEDIKKSLRELNDISSNYL